MTDEIGPTNDDAVAEATGEADPRALLEAMPFSRVCGVEIGRATPEEVRGWMAWAPERCTTGGAMHGGALMALADSLGGACAVLNLPPGAATTTLESKTNFFHAVREGEVRAVARPLHVGRTTIVVETDLYDPRGRRVARVVQTQLVLR